MLLLKAERCMYIRLIVHDLLLFPCSLVHRLKCKCNVISCVWAICLRVNAEICYSILTRIHLDVPKPGPKDTSGSQRPGLWWLYSAYVNWSFGRICYLHVQSNPDETHLNFHLPVRLSALCAGSALPPQEDSWYSFLLEAEAIALLDWILSAYYA
jgi:hypothetical protein